MTDHDEFVPFFMQFGDFNMYFGNQRASGIKYPEASSGRFMFNFFRYAMCTEHKR